MAQNSNTLPNPLDPDRPIELTPAQVRAEDPAFQVENPARAMLDRYKNPYHAPSTKAYAAGESLRNYLMGPNAYGALLNKGPMVGGLTSALAAGGLGYLGGSVSDWVRGTSGTGARLGLLAALLAGGIGAYSGHLRTKTAGWRSSVSDHDAIMAAINKAQLSFNDKSALISAVSKLSGSQKRQLSGMLSGASGAVIGAIIVRFLAGAGLGGMLLGALAGSMVGRTFSSGNRYNALGHLVL